MRASISKLAARLAAFAGRLPGPSWAWALGAACLVLAGGLAFFALPFLREERQTVASTPAPAPSSELQYNPVRLEPRRRLCMAPVTLPPDGRLIRLRTVDAVADGPPMSLRVDARGYSDRARIDGFDGSAILFPVEPPARALSGGRVCVRNDGRRAVTLVGSTEAFTASARPVSEIGGEEIAEKVALSFLTGDDRGLARHVGDVLERAAIFKPFGPIVLGIALALFLIVLPVATIGALVVSLRETEAEPPEAKIPRR